MNAILDVKKPAVEAQSFRERDLIAIVEGLSQELHPQHGRHAHISTSSWLERDLGIDSLARTELVLRLERTFGARLPISLLAEADTVGDLIGVLEKAVHPGARTVAPSSIAPSLSVISAATEAKTLVDVLGVARCPESRSSTRHSARR